MAHWDVLIDMDGVLVEFHGGFLKVFNKRYPNAPYKTLEELTEFYIRDNYPLEWKDKIDAIYYSPGFYPLLMPVPGGIEAVKAIVAAGCRARICTTPFSPLGEISIQEKRWWMEFFLGQKFAEEMIFEKDKTLIHADKLIDDKPLIQGIRQPSWEHLLFDRPFNQNVDGKRRITWKNFAEVLGI